MPLKVAIVGIGNVLLKDEGIGVYLAQQLQKMTPPEGIDMEVIDGGTFPDILLTLKGVDKLIIIDAAKGGGEPGTVYRFHPKDVSKGTQGIISLHQMGLPQTIKLMEHWGIKPHKTVIFGIEPKEIDWGLEPSLELKGKAPQIIQWIMEEVRATKQD